jgi:hypothetical protein
MRAKFCKTIESPREMTNKFSASPRKGRKIILSIKTPKAARIPMASARERKKFTPKYSLKKNVANPPSMKISPWAKLMTPMILKMRVKPKATRR